MPGHDETGQMRAMRAVRDPSVSIYICLNSLPGYNPERTFSYLSLCTFVPYDPPKIISMRNKPSGAGQQEVTLVKNSNARYMTVIPTRSFLLRDQYSLHPYVLALPGFTNSKASSSRIRYPQLILSMKVTRMPNFYVQVRCVIFRRRCRLAVSRSHRHPTSMSDVCRAFVHLRCTIIHGRRPPDQRPGGSTQPHPHVITGCDQVSTTPSSTPVS